MKISDYCHYGCANGVPAWSVVGNPDIDLLEQWNRWRENVSPFVQNRISFIDVPGESNDRRILIFALPDKDRHMVVAFTVFCSDLPFNAQYFASVYKSIEKISPQSVLDAIQKRVPFDFPVVDVSFERPPLTPNIAELRGLQLIGNAGKTIYTISRMIPENVSQTHFHAIWLAVNPISYDNDFTTVISEETPKGEWEKLASNNAKRLSADVRQNRRNALIRRWVTPYFLFWILTSVTFFLGFVVALIFGYRAKEKAFYLEQQLSKTRKEYEFFEQKTVREKEELQSENTTLKATISRMELQSSDK